MNAEDILNERKLKKIREGYHTTLMEVIGNLIDQYGADISQFEEGYNVGLKDGKLGCKCADSPPVTTPKKRVMPWKLLKL